MAEWIIDKKAKTATIALFGGELKVFVRGDGKPEAHWRRDDAPAESRAFRIDQAQAALEAAAAGKESADRIVHLQIRLGRARQLPDPIRPEGLLEVTAFVHAMAFSDAMNAAPMAIRSSLRQTHPELFAAISAEPQPAAVKADPF